MARETLEYTFCILRPGASCWLTVSGIWGSNLTAAQTKYYISNRLQDQKREDPAYHWEEAPLYLTIECLMGQKKGTRSSPKVVYNPVGARC